MFVTKKIDFKVVASIINNKKKSKTFLFFMGHFRHFFEELNFQFFQGILILSGFDGMYKITKL